MVVISGATGYLGKPLCRILSARGFPIRAVVRSGSAAKLPSSVEPIIADPLTAATFARYIPAGATFIHLLGTPRPSPWKTRQFREVDLPGAMAAIDAATQAGVAHFIYVSVAHPAPIMCSYIEVRRDCENALVTSGLRHTILRPWYVLGPGHRWPYALTPLYWLAARIPAWKESAERLGLVTHKEMLAALAWTVDHPPNSGRQVLEASAIALR